MAEEIIEHIYWTDLAQQSFDKIISYLQSNWTEKEITKFIAQTTTMLSNLRQHPEMGRASERRKNTRIVILNKHTKMVYNVKARQKTITILLFWNFKQDPSKFKY